MQEQFTLRHYLPEDVPAMREIWNEVIDDAKAFPQTEGLGVDEAADFFAAQTVTVVAQTEGQTVGLFIVHPNNVGRCSHIANASYAVGSAFRGRGIGQALVADSLVRAKEAGFSIMQFNAVVDGNLPALAIYRKLGFVELGVIPKGFVLGDGTMDDIHLFYREL